jgi:S-DNA-T family DNA segregation ATPase FtsK/SpoIIIE
MAQLRKHNGWNEVLGLIFLGIGTVLFLALISYTPKDIPSWIWFSNESPANNPAQNLIGPTGAVIAGFLYMTVGAASYLVVSILLGFGGAKLFFPGFRISKRLLWALLFVASGASMAHLQPWFLHSWTWKREFVDLGPGGWIGSNLGGKLFQTALGQIGSVIALAVVYLISLIWLTGIRPVLVLKQLLLGASDYLQRLKQARERQRLAAVGKRERLEADQKRIQREIRKQEKELKRKGVPLDELADEGVYPEPKIIDTSTVLPAKAKLPLADAKHGKPKEPSPPLPSQNIEHYELPSVDLLARIDVEVRKAADPAELKQTQSILIDTLKQFNIEASPGDITRGPTITRYEVYPARGVRVDKISSLERDLARATRAERINILAPIPGKDTVGIEIANTKKIKVVLREILESEEWVHTSYRIPIVLGKDVYGKIILGDLAQMPHCLVAGTTGSGKSVCVNAIIASMLYRFRPDELRFVMIDPKVVEMQVYNTLPHLVMPVVTDPKKVLLALRWVINEMENRYKIFAKVNVRNITGFNSRPKPKSQKELDAEKPASSDPDEDAGNEGMAHGVAEPAPMRVPRDDDLIVPDKMPFVVVIIDELADLMQTAPADVEAAIARITQMARAAGIHMIVATQTPRADVVTGVIKANIPTRIAFQVASALDSRVILDENGAERLLGQGDMFYRPPGTSRLVRSQGVLVTDEEIHELVDFVAAQALPMFDPDIQNQLASAGGSEEEDVSEEDEALVEKCLEIIRQEKRASTSMLQRRLRLGYTRAARVVDILERRGILGPGEGAKPREILVNLDALV